MAAYGPVIRLELVREGGIIARADGEEAAAIWRGIAQAIQVAEAYGYPYRGPKLRLVPPPTSAGDIATAIEEAPTAEEGESHG